MYGIFMESWVIFKNFIGNGYIVPLALVCLVYLLIIKDDLRRKLPLAVCSAGILIIYFIPVTRKVFVRLLEEGDTYYRILWMIPWTVIIAYTLCMIFAKHRKIGLVVATVLTILAGSLVYRNQYVSKAENLYHLPQVAIDVCDVIAPAEGERRVRALFPAELVHFVRQYDTDIMMPYGREIIASQWSYTHPLYEIFEDSETIDANALVESTREYRCDYIVIHYGRSIEPKLTDLGLYLKGEAAGYLIYEDPEVKDDL